MWHLPRVYKYYCIWIIEVWHPYLSVFVHCDSLKNSALWVIRKFAECPKNESSLPWKCLPSHLPQTEELCSLISQPLSEIKAS